MGSACSQTIWQSASPRVPGIHRHLVKRQVELNLAYRWFCRLGLEDRVPNHSTFSVNRHGRFRESDVLRKVFESIVHRCMGAGLVGGEGFAVDASVIEADASRFQRVEGNEIDWTQAQQASRPVREYLAALDGDNELNAVKVMLSVIWGWLVRLVAPRS